MALCISCPFNLGSEDSEYAQNLGCLPTPKEVLQLKDDTGHNWACHHNNKRPCQGLAKHRDVKTGGLYILPGTNAEFKSWKPEDQEPIIL